MNSILAWLTGIWFPETLETAFLSVLIEKFPGGACPQTPLGSSRFRRSQLASALRRQKNVTSGDLRNMSTTLKICPNPCIGATYVSFQIKKTSVIIAQNLIVLFIYSCLGGFGGGARYMYLARVLVGRYCQGHSTMVVPPPINPYRNPEILYESVVDDPGNPSKFVVFYDNQCYPEYVITYFTRTRFPQYRRPVSSVGRVPDYRAGGRGFKHRPDQHSGSLNNWGESAAFLMTSANS